MMYVILCAVDGVTSVMDFLFPKDLHYENNENQ